jgi:hypothetical protein
VPCLNSVPHPRVCFSAAPTSAAAHSGGVVESRAAQCLRSAGPSRARRFGGGSAARRQSQCRVSCFGANQSLSPTPGKFRLSLGRTAAGAG